MSMLPGALVYIKDTAQVWLPASIKTVDVKKCSVIVDGIQEPRECPLESVLPRSEQSLLPLNSLTELSPINEASVICCLCARYGETQFYTHAGSTIVAVNPFHDVPHLYTHQQIHAYHRQSQESPHIYKVSCEAYKRLCQGLGHVDQCIIVSGESGSGKTVSAKHLLRYMTVVSNVISKADTSAERVVQSVEQRILDSNPILEAFGNAVTQRNDNSSRFGKFIQLQFNKCGQMVGGEIHTYLLEKTRIVHQSDTESNFHIFYQIMNCLREDRDSPLGRLIQEMGDNCFRTLPPGKSTNKNRDFSETLQAMTQLGLTETQQNDVTKMLVAILFVCNIKINAIEEELCQLLNDKDDQFLDTAFMALEVSEASVCQVSSLLGVQVSCIEQALLYRNIQSGGNRRRSVFVKPVPKREADARRDCLATLLYSTLFEWLVKYINNQIRADNFDHTIGLLDIYGFEAFETNSLEQLCINYANERIQQQYVKHFLKDLQMEYEAECINWQHLDYTDNQACLDVLDAQPSVFGLLNEDVQLNRQTNSSQLCERISGLCRGSAYVSMPRNHRLSPSFIVHHYAGDVTYSTDELSNKNRDNVPQEIVNMLQNSSCRFVADLFKEYVTEDCSGRKRKTVLGKFKVSMDSLMLSLKKADIHYIRCIKPNRRSVAGVFDRPYVMGQLQAGGIIETVKISSKGYPVRMLYSVFLKKYGMIIRHTPRAALMSDDEAPDVDTDEPLDTLYKKQLDMLPDTPRKSNTPRKKLRRRAGMSSADHTRRCCATVLKIQFGNSNSLLQQFGKTKLFLHQHQVEDLERSRHRIMCLKASAIQRCWLRYRHLKEIERQARMAAAVCRIQQAWRLYVKHRRTRAAIVLQKSVRMYSARLRYKCLLAQDKLEKKRRKKNWKPIMDRKRTSPRIRQHGLSSSGEESRISDTSASSSMASSSDSSIMTFHSITEPLDNSCGSDGLKAKTPTQDLSGVCRTSTPLSAQGIGQSSLEPSDGSPKTTNGWAKPRHSSRRQSSSHGPYSKPQDSDSDRNSTDTLKCVQEQNDTDSSLGLGKENMRPSIKSPVSQPGKRCLTSRGRPNVSPLKRRRSNQNQVASQDNAKNSSPVSMGTRSVARGTRMVAMGDASGVSPVKKQKTETGFTVTLDDLAIGDSILSKRRLPKVPIRFHTRASVLKHGHYVHRKELECGLQDALATDKHPACKTRNQR